MSLQLLTQALPFENICPVSAPDVSADTYDNDEYRWKLRGTVLAG